jgi:hypothetical protein
MNIKLVSSVRIPKPTSLLAFRVDFFYAEWQQRKSFCFCGERFRQDVRARIRHDTLVRHMVNHVL